MLPFVKNLHAFPCGAGNSCKLIAILTHFTKIVKNLYKFENLQLFDLPESLNNSTYQKRKFIVQRRSVH